MCFIYVFTYILFIFLCFRGKGMRGGFKMRYADTTGVKASSSNHTVIIVGLCIFCLKFKTFGISFDFI